MTVTTNWTSPAAAGTLDLAAGAILTEAVWDAMVSNFGHIGGTTGMAAVAFTPTLAQSVSVTASTATGRYFRLGVWVVYTIRLVASSAGTAGNTIVVGGLPIVAGNTAAFAGPGFAHFARGTNPVYPLAANWQTSSSLRFFANAGTGLFGANPAVTLTSGDEMNVAGFYEGV